MSRLTLVLGLLVAVLAGGIASTWLNRPAVPDFDEARVRAIAQQVVDAAPRPVTLDQNAVESIVRDAMAKLPQDDLPQSTAELDAATLNPMIEDYLLKNPRILQRVSAALQDEIAATRAAEAKAAIGQYQEAIYQDPDHVVLGNPDGDVTLVEMFDYNCGYCRQSLPDLAQLLDEDPNLKVILKEYPILSQGSVDAARVAVLVSEAKVDYWTFHQELFTSPGQVDKSVALKAAADLGLNPITLELEMNTPAVTAVIDKSYKLAQGLNVSGTPTYIIGDEIIPGAVPIDQLRARIANMRACGATQCPDPAQPG